jgi:hypothetical protein
MTVVRIGEQGSFRTGALGFYPGSKGTRHTVLTYCAGVPAAVVWRPARPFTPQELLCLPNVGCKVAFIFAALKGPDLRHTAQPIRYIRC